MKNAKTSVTARSTTERTVKLTIPQCLCLLAGADIDLDLMLAQLIGKVSEEDIQKYLEDYCASDQRPISRAVLYSWINKYHVEVTDV